MRKQLGEEKIEKQEVLIDFSNPYRVMWQELIKRVNSGAMAWGKMELQTIIREIEIAVWRKADYLKGKEEADGD